MKYREGTPPAVCMMTQSTCYRNSRLMAVRGVLWHSTGANNPNLKRYVQPDDNAPDRAELLALLGKNTNGNDWNHIAVEAGLNAWIGKLADGSVASVQTMPWNFRPWGCGSGRKGSCNDGWIQFEICEDDLTDGAYFEAAYREACELTAYLCVLYGLDPFGTALYAGTEVPVILCHRDSAALGLGSSHADVLHWFGRYGRTMDDVRRDVAALMAEREPEPEPDEDGFFWYTVQEGDSLWAIAERFLGSGLRYPEILAWNSLTDSMIWPGQRLRIPDQTPAPDPTEDWAQVCLPVLHEGDSSLAVQAVQYLLTAKGYDLPEHGCDGEFGGETMSAVRAFQEDHGIACGNVDAKTWTALVLGE